MKISDALFLQQPWLITTTAHAAMVSAIQSQIAGPFSFGEDDEEEDDCCLCVENGIGIVSIKGPMMRNPHPFLKAFCGVCDMEEIGDAIEECGKRADVQAVMLDIDSPGGTVNGTPELAQAVAELAAKKQCYSFTAGQMCSAAIWVGSQCDASYATQSARVGSIGVILPVIDVSEAYKQAGYKVEVFAAGKYKSAGVPGTSLTEDQKALIQADIDEVMVEFRKAVTARRSIPEDAMQGQTFSAQNAQKNGMAIVVKNRAEVINNIRIRHVR